MTAQKTYKSDPDDLEYINLLIVSEPLKKTITQQAIKDLNIKSGSKILDVGCGIGYQAILLAEATGKGGCVTALDLNARFLKYAQKHIITDRVKNIKLKQGDIYNLPFSDSTFDYIWGMDFAGYADPHNDQLKELIRVTNPNGMIALLFWSAQTLLPGYPELEAQLNATPAGIAPFKTGMLPESHFLCTHEKMRSLNLVNIQMQTYTQHIIAPLDQEKRKAMMSLLDMRWQNPKDHVSPQVWQEYQRICLPNSPDFILNKPNYSAFYTYTMFTGNVN